MGTFLQPKQNGRKLHSCAQSGRSALAPIADILLLSHHRTMWWTLLLSILAWIAVVGQGRALIDAARTGVIGLRAGHFRYRRAEEPTTFWMHVSLSALFMLFAFTVGVIATSMLFGSH